MNNKHICKLQKKKNIVIKYYIFYRKKLERKKLEYVRIRIQIQIRNQIRILGSGSADPDPHQNEADPKHCLNLIFFVLIIVSMELEMHFILSSMYIKSNK